MSQIILKTSDTWKIQLKIVIGFISSEDNDEESVMHSKSENKEIMINGTVGKVIKNFFESILNRYQNNLEKLMKDSEFVFDYVHLLCYKCHKTTPNCDGSIQALPIGQKKTLINPINKKYNKCF